jgi:SAM-dependent methyltransferase
MSQVTLSSSSAPSPIQFNQAAFNQVYNESVLGGSFLEVDSYYVQQKPRYQAVIQELCKLSLPQNAKVLEIGGGQIALLTQKLYDYDCTVADVSEEYSKGILTQGIGFRECDLLHDDLADRNQYDLIVLCEVIEHMPIPPHIVLEKMKAWLKPGGILFLTTPNLYRLRNLIRMAVGLRVFDTFLIPERGHGIGHPIEYSASHMQWQLETAGFEQVSIQLRQLDNAGSSWKSQLGRILASPLMLRPLWRDKLVAIAYKP